MSAYLIVVSLVVALLFSFVWGFLIGFVRTLRATPPDDGAHGPQHRS